MVYVVLLLDNRRYITCIKGIFETEEKAQEYVDFFKENATWGNRLYIEEHSLE